MAWRRARHRIGDGILRLLRMTQTPYLLSLPALLLFAAIVIVPLVMTVLLSFHDWGQYKGIEPVFILKNWHEVFTDSYSWRCSRAPSASPSRHPARRAARRARGLHPEPHGSPGAASSCW